MAKNGYHLNLLQFSTVNFLFPLLNKHKYFGTNWAVRLFTTAILSLSPYYFKEVVPKRINTRTPPFLGGGYIWTHLFFQKLKKDIQKEIILLVYLVNTVLRGSSCKP